MRLAFKTSRTGWVAVVQAALALVGSGFGAIIVGLPGPGGDAPLALLIALLATLLIAPGIVHTWPKDRTVPARSAGIVTLLIVLAQLAPSLLIAVVFGVSGGAAGLTYAGILLWLLAIQFTAGVMVSSTYQGVAPAVYVLLCALFGRIDSAVQPWAWPLAGINPAISLLLGGTAFVLASTLLAAIGLHRSTSN